MPAEADGKFDPRADMRGSGPWRIVRWDQSQQLIYERNDDWYLKKPFLDGIQLPIGPTDNR
jgi:ABC-type transport system substrate-binding protein